VLRITERGGVFGTFMRGVRFEFSAIGGAVLFDFLGFIFGELGFRGSLIFRCVLLRFVPPFFLFGFFFLRKFCFGSGVNFLYFVLFELGATGKSIGVGVCGSFLVFCFDKLRREGSGLIFTEITLSILGRYAASRWQLEWRSFVPRRIRAVRRKGGIFRSADVFVGRNRSGFGFGSGVSENPAGKSTGEAAGNVGAGGPSSRDGSAQSAWCTGGCLFDFGLRLV
jgi:hypothetical protein